MKKRNLIYTGSNGKKSGYDLSIPNNFNGTLIYFIHGYKGYKNWGCWDLISDYFYNNGFGFAKCNLSHNGTTLENPNSFDDLVSFGENRYSYELTDIQNFIAEVEKETNKFEIIKRVLIGHSRGGGDAILSVSNCPKIDILITWASIADIGSRFPKGSLLNKWKEDGLFYVLNGRTNQNMPHKYSFYLDFIEKQKDLDIKSKASEITIPWCIIHGKSDTSVKPEEAKLLKKYAEQAELILIDNANHVFGGNEPFVKTVLPEDTKVLVEKTITFITENNN